MAKYIEAITKFWEGIRGEFATFINQFLKKDADKNIISSLVAVINGFLQGAKDADNVIEEE